MSHFHRVATAFSKGEPSCEVCLGSGVLNNDSVDDCSCVEPYQKSIREADTSQSIRLLIDELEGHACSCDIMYGFNCEVHELVRKLIKKLEVRDLL